MFQRTARHVQERRGLSALFEMQRPGGTRRCKVAWEIPKALKARH